MSKVHTTYVVTIESTSRYGLNQDYYFRTEAEANRQAAELREWYKNLPCHKITITSHQWTN